MTPGTAQLEPVAGRSRWSWLQSAAEMAALYSGAWSGPALPLAASAPQAPRLATRSPAPTVSSLAAARSFTLTTMDRWGAAGCADDVAAVISELLANALRHALPRAGGATGAGRSRPIRLGLLDLEPWVLCAVADPSAQPPVHRQPDWLEESGRGLQVVASLSSHWGFCVAPDMQGKVVWATISRNQQQDQQQQQRLSAAGARGRAAGDSAAGARDPAAGAGDPAAGDPAAGARGRSAVTPAGAAGPFARRGPTSRPRHWPPRQPSAPDSACHTVWSAAAAAGPSA
jgi:hypothetical protein